MDISNVVNSSKFEHHERLTIKFNDPKKAAKTYWYILKTDLMISLVKNAAQKFTTALFQQI